MASKSRTRPQPKPRGTATAAKKTQVPGAHARGAVKAVAAARHAPGGQRDMADTTALPPAFPLGEPGTAAGYTKGYAVVPDLGDVMKDPSAAIPGGPGQDSK